MEFLRPIIFFDLETTGTLVAKDRILELYAMKVIDKLPDEILHFYFNPGFPIPAASTAIHGITNEYVSDMPQFRDKVFGILEFFKDCDLAGHNIIRFDIPMLSEEFLRCGLELNISGVNVIDTMLIQTKLFPKDLRTLFFQYTGFQYEDAHTASSDVRACMEVFEAQIALHGDKMGRNTDDINKFCQDAEKRFIDFDNRLYLGEDGVPRFAFGGSKDKPVKEDVSFAEWMLRQDFITLNTKSILRKILKGTYE